MPIARTPRIDSNRYRFLGVLESAADGHRRLFPRPAGLDDRPAPSAGGAGHAHALGRDRSLAGAERSRTRIAVAAWFRMPICFGPTAQLAGAGLSNAGRPRLPIRLMASAAVPQARLQPQRRRTRASAGARTWSGSSSAAWSTTSRACRATPRRSGAFAACIGEDGLEQLLKATIESAVAIKAVKTDRARARDRGHHGAGEGHRAPGGQPPAGDRAPQGGQRRQARGIALKQTFAKEGKELRRKAGGYAHAKQFKRLRKHGQAPAHDPGRRSCARCSASWKQFRRALLPA